MKTLVSRFVKDESGATAIEYGLIAAGISVAIIVQQPFGPAEVSGVRCSVATGLRSPPGPFRIAAALPRAIR